LKFSDSDGSYTYTPNGNSLVSVADDVFVYTIEDADGTQSTTTLTITIQPSGSSSADLSITKAVDTTNLDDDLSGYVIYTLVASNAGGDAATGVSVTDLLPAGLTFVEASTAVDFVSPISSQP